jgi:hypothetical protein
MDAADILAPHQYGVGVPSGAESIIHSLQHSLTDKHAKMALLKVDITNAFNSCDRARVLRELYQHPKLSAMFRIADFGYAVPSQLLLQRCDGRHLLSSNGVRQGDPLSAILFCLYIREVLSKVSTQAKVEVDGFFDDVNVLGEPGEVMKALDALKKLLPEVGLEFNMAKSHFAYFHEADAPLLRSVRTTLADHDIQVRTDWVEVVGAVVGKDEDAIRAGVAATLTVDAGTAAFFERLQLMELNVQSAMLILRQCAVPKMNFALRCIPPACIANQATAFDALVIGAAKSKLLLHVDEAKRRPTADLLQAPLRYGGFGLTPALKTSAAAYLGSMAAVKDAPTFVKYSQPDSPLPSTALVHGWIDESMASVIEATPECKEHLPTSASSFFQHFSRPSSSQSVSRKTSSLQRTLSSLATESESEASLTRAKQMRSVDGGLSLAHLRAVSAPRAWAWKTVVPTTKDLELTDTQYRIATRLNLGLLPVEGTAALPDTCPLCAELDCIKNNPWHFMTCTNLTNGEVTVRHDEVESALYRSALAMGLQAVRQPKGLYTSSDLRPDLLVILPGRRILTDVAICHPLAPARLKRATSLRTLGTALRIEGDKRRKYTKKKAQYQVELLPFVAETCGGLAPAAVKFLKALAEAGEEHLPMWPKDDIIRHVVGTVAIAVQRGGAMAYLEGYYRALSAMGKPSDKDKKGDDVEQGGEEEEVEDGEGVRDGEDVAAPCAA